MYNAIVIPSEIFTKGEQFFATRMLQKGQTVIETGRITVSFHRNRGDTFLVSGIVTDSDSHQVKVQTVKDEETSEIKLKTQCNCMAWNDQDHCPHTAGLYLHFELSQNSAEKSDKDDLKSHILFHGQGVHVENYGRIEKSAHSLKGAHPNSTYASVQYLLTSRKAINFPYPKDFHGKIIVNFVSATKFEEFETYPNIESKFIPVFSYRDPEDNIHTKISLFESLYIFNWESGLVLNIPSNVGHTLKLMVSQGVLNEINDHLKLVRQLIDEESLEVQINGVKFNEINSFEAQTRFSIKQSKRKGFLDFHIELYDDKERLISPPAIFKTLVGENGFLNSFRTKNDSYEFIKILLDSLEFDNVEYKKFAYSSSSRAKLIEWIEYFQSYDDVVFYDESHKLIYTYRTDLFKEILIGIFECFTESAARFSFYSLETKSVYYQLPKSYLYNGVASFYKRMQKFKLPIFYNNVEIKTWSSNIRFERKKSNLDWFEVNLVIDEKDLEVIKNAQVGEDYIVSGDKLILLDTKEKELLKFMKRYTKHEAKGSEIDQSNIKKFALNFKRSRIFELFELKKHGIDGALTPEEEVICENLLNMKEMPTYPLPKILEAIPREYQATGYQWLRFLYENRFGACLADDMGLGKTLQTIMFLESIIDQVEQVLIVCPVSILLNWKNEIEKFSTLDVDIYYGEGRKLTPGKKVILTSYGVMKKESYTTFNEKLLDILIMDEVQHLKNIRSQGATAARNLNAKFRICLTGTPVENDLSEFYNIMDLSIPGIWGDLSLFRSSSSKKSRLLARQTVRPFILRRTKEQVLTELPEKVENHVFLSFSPDEKEHYLSTLASIRQKITTAGQGKKYSEILKSLLQLRQLCLWQNQKYIQSTKIDFLMENLEQLMVEGHKVLVFSQFTTYLDHIQNKIRERSWKFARIDGSQTMKKRQLQVDEFQDGDAQIFLISLKAGGVGLNLTAASYIFLMDPWWNPAVENQAIDRAYRIGQKNKLTVYRPIIKDSVEEKVIVLQNTKKELFKDLMNGDKDGESFFSGKLSLDDFQQLIT